MNRGYTVLHRNYSVVNRGSTGASFLLNRGNTGVTPGLWERNLFFRKSVPVHHGIPADLYRGEPGPYRHCENGALVVKEMST